MAVLTSLKNPLLKEARRAVARGGLTADGCVVAETFHLLEEALRSGCEIEAVLAAPQSLPEAERLLQTRAGTRLLELPGGLFDRISATESNQGVMALVRPPAWTLDRLLQGLPLLAVLDGIQDPGNAGAIVRAAEAFGATGVVFLKGSVNPYNAKAVRASAGSVFRVPLISGAEDSLLALLGEMDLYATVPSGGHAPGEADLTRPCAILIGSEGHGVNERLLSQARRLRIPTTGVESLNAAMAAGIILYEARRQRMAVP